MLNIVNKNCATVVDSLLGYMWPAVDGELHDITINEKVYTCITPVRTGT